MAYIAVIVALICLIIAIMYNKDKIFSPIILFFGLWFFILLLSSLRITNLTSPTDFAYLLIVLMLSCFLCGNIIISLILKKKSKLENGNNQIKYSPLYVLYCLFCIAILVLNIIDIIIILKYHSRGIPMWQLRNWALEPFGSNNPLLSRQSFIESILRSIVLEPFGLLIHPIAAFNVFYDNNKKRKILITLLSILCLVTSSLAGGGGRISFIYFVACYALAFLCAYKEGILEHKILKKYKKALIIGLILSFACVVGLTIVRVGNGSFLKQVYKYFSVPPTLLSKWIPSITKTRHTYGLLTTFGIHSYFFRGLDYLGLDNYVPTIFYDAFNHLLNAEKFLQVGDGTANAFVTPVYYFYIDGGIPFVAFASLIFGSIVTYIFNKISQKFNFRYFLIYMLIMYGVFVSFMRIQTAIPSFIISIIYVYIFSKKGKSNDNKNTKQ